VTVTIRGRDVREPALWAIGALVALFTPLAWAPIVFLIVLGALTSFVVPLAIVILVGVALTRWATRSRTGLSRRAWSVGLWFLLLGVAFFGFGLVAGMFFDPTGVGMGGIVSTTVGVMAGVAMIVTGALLAPIALRMGEALFERGPAAVST
jgi:O-antigen/teichoic acid export membrane protein